MTVDQMTVFAVLAVTLVFFIWNRWRYDIVAVAALLVIAVAGLVPADQVFSGLGHPAVVTVAAVLVLSRGLLNAGVVDAIARSLTGVGERRGFQVATLTGIVALSSGFMNNVGALALFMPVAVWMSRRSGRSPAFLLMPLAFASLLGGTLTLIGTPPNILIAAYRTETGMVPFGMFAFLPVGAGITLAGLAFIALAGWRLTPCREDSGKSGELFEISAYLTELRIPEGSKYADRTLHDLVAAVKEDAEVTVLGLVREGKRQALPPSYAILREDDILLVEADSDSLKAFLDTTGLVIAEAGEADAKGESRSGDLNLVEAIVTAGSMLVGRTVTDLDVRQRYGINVLAVARQGRRLSTRLARIPFAAGDILLVQAREEAVAAALNPLGCLPLASRGLRIAKPRKVLVAAAIFGTALALIAAGWVSAATALVAGALAMVLAGLIAPSEIYKSGDMPVLILLAAMLPIGQAMETTGGAALIAGVVLRTAGSAPPVVTLAILMAAVMLLSNVVNNAAAAVLAAPVAIDIARGMDYAADPFLMAVAVSASCAFLTPIGHQSNTLVMEPGGYRFGDYWRLGLPLSVLVIAAGAPLILWIWPV